MAFALPGRQVARACLADLELVVNARFGPGLDVNTLRAAGHTQIFFSVFVHNAWTAGSGQGGLSEGHLRKGYRIG